MGHKLHRWMGLAGVGADPLRTLMRTLEAGADFRSTYDRLESEARR